MKTPTDPRQAGFTLFEVLTTAAVLLVVSGPMLKAYLEISRGLTTESSRAYQITRGDLALTRISEELRSGTFSADLFDPSGQATSLDVLPVTGFDGTDPIYGDFVTIEARATESDGDDGIDNDQDGLIDEQELLIWIDSVPTGDEPGPEDQQISFVQNLTADGLLFTLNGNSITIQLQIQVVVETGEDPIVYPLETAVSVRNE